VLIESIGLQPKVTLIRSIADESEACYSTFVLLRCDTGRIQLRLKMLGEGGAIQPRAVAKAVVGMNFLNFKEEAFPRFDAVGRRGDRFFVAPTLERLLHELHRRIESHGRLINRLKPKRCDTLVHPARFDDVYPVEIEHTGITAHSSIRDNFNATAIPRVALAHDELSAVNFGYIASLRKTGFFAWFDSDLEADHSINIVRNHVGKPVSRPFIHLAGILNDGSRSGRIRRMMFVCC